MNSIKNYILHGLDVANKSAQEVMADVMEITVDEDYLLISGQSNTDMDGIPLFYCKLETGVWRVE